MIAKQPHQQFEVRRSGGVAYSDNAFPTSSHRGVPVINTVFTEISTFLVLLHFYIWNYDLLEYTRVQSSHI